MKVIKAYFYKSNSGREPVRDWLINLSKDEKFVIGVDIKTVEFGWPIGMPVCKPLGQGLYEVRSHLPSDKIARVIFCIHNDQMILLHGFIKKTQKAPLADITIAHTRLRSLNHGK